MTRGQRDKKTKGQNYKGENGEIDKRTKGEQKDNKT